MFTGDTFFSFQPAPETKHQAVGLLGLGCSCKPGLGFIWEVGKLLPPNQKSSTILHSSEMEPSPRGHKKYI